MSDETTPGNVRLNDGLSQPALQGHMYLARKQCGKVVAASWDDKGAENDNAKSIARWLMRGDTVEKVARYKGDPQPDWCCSPGAACACREAGLRA